MAEVGGTSREMEFHPLTPERWPDLVDLFGERGAWGASPRGVRGGRPSFPLPSGVGAPTVTAQPLQPRDQRGQEAP